MNLKIIILDFDGTLGDSQKLIVDTMLKTIKQAGFDLPAREQCAAMIGLPLKQTFTELIPMTDEQGDLCANIYRGIFTREDVKGAVNLFPHVLDTLHELHNRGHILTIASSRVRYSLLKYIEDLNLGNLISFVVSAKEVAHAKPHPEMVLNTLKHFNCPPEEALVVGDTVYDIKMGLNAGAHTCGVTYGNGKKEELIECKSDFLINDFSELLHIVQK